jgi:hypothetical protein
MVKEIMEMQDLHLVVVVVEVVELKLEVLHMERQTLVQVDLVGVV